MRRHHQLVFSLFKFPCLNHTSIAWYSIDAYTLKDGFMWHPSSLNILPIGLLELDATGTILYFKPDKGTPPDCSSEDVVGRNLFTDIIPIAEDKEFKERIKAFEHSHVPTDSFHFTFSFGQSDLAVKVLLARIHEQSLVGNNESILIHIRRQAVSIAA